MNLITLDFETYYSKEYSLSKTTTEAYIRDKQFEVIGVGVKINEQQATWFSGAYEKTKDYLHSLDIPNSNLLCHHTAFDGAILNWRFGLKPKYYFDTLSMARPITGHTVGGSLAALVKLYHLGEKGTEVVQALGKRRSDFGFSDLHQYGEYCKNDCELTYKLFKVLLPHSTKHEMYIIDLMLRMFTDPVLELDREILLQHLAQVQDKKQSLMDKIDATIGRDNLLSNPQFAEVLRSLGVEPPMKTSPATGKETYAFAKTDQEFKELLEHENEEVQAVVSARFGIKSTLEETRTEAFINISDRGTLPILLNYYGAHTGRASGGDKINLQNLPRGGSLRQAITAPTGHTLVAVDSSQIEARVVAWLAGETDLVEAFAQGRDIYSEFASDVYGRPIDRKRKAYDADGKEFNPDKLEGFIGKTCILGLGYGMGKDKFRATLKIGQGGVSADITEDEAERIVGLYRDKYPSIVGLWKQGQEALEAMSKGVDFSFGEDKILACNKNGIHLPNGMWLKYNELGRTPEKQFQYKTKSGYTKLYGGKVIENVVQALARIVVFDQMARIEQELRPKNKPYKHYRTALTVHDEVVSVVPDEDAQWALDMMQACMSKAPAWAKDLPIACEGAMGKNYADCK
jgi:DNA polymerase